ncbi:MAG: hypothetical protein AAF346_23235 [Pseudomonadota bacterium]
MGRMKLKAQTEFALFNVMYEDGTQTSNRKVPVHEINGLNADECIQAVIEAQDAEIAERSGKQRGPIKSIEKVKARKAE